MKTSFAKILSISTLVAGTAARKIVLTNDDGWAVAQLRDEYNQLKAAGFEVILSAPAINKSGSGASTTTPVPLTDPCQFDTCPAGSPPTGTDPDDPNIHYVNAFPVDAVQLGIQNFSEALWGTKPDFVISGSNVGNNLGGIRGSGTVGAAGEAVKEGIPSFAFSGASASSVSYTTLTTDPDAASTINANIYTSLILKFLSVYLPRGHRKIREPHGFSININFSATSNCDNDPDNFQWIATRLVNSTAGVDTPRCGTRNLPDETTVSRSGCFVTVSVFDATSKLDAPAHAQRVVFNELKSILTCL